MSKRSNDARRKSHWLNERQDHELAEKKALVLRLHQQGKSRAQIAKMVGVPGSSVKNWLAAVKPKEQPNQESK